MNEIIEKEIKDYVRKYSQKHHITEEEARKHIIVKFTEEYYKQNKNR